MRPMHATIDGIEYATATSVLLASTHPWDGYSWETPPVDIFLFRTPGGAYFEVRQQGNHVAGDQLAPLNHDLALALYRALPVHHWDEEHAFRTLWAQH